VPITADALPVLAVVLLILVGPAGILIHELGHGLMALWLTDGPVQVLVGRQPGLLRIRLGRLGLHLHIEPARGVGWGGLCLFKNTGPRDRVLIAAAGPIASLMWTLTCTAALAVWGVELDTAARLALAVGILEGTIAFVYNGAAAVLPDLATARPRSDGAQIRRALAASKQLRQLEADIGRKLTKAELRHMITTKGIPRDLLRERTSVPPPPGPTPAKGTTLPD
jgi:hypothetical protein